ASAVGQSLYSEDPHRAVLRFLREKRLLLILDNFEHLLASETGVGEPSAASLVIDLTQNAPDVQLLVTSRERLHVRGEQVTQVHGLEHIGDVAASPSVQLFVHAARRTQPHFELQSSGLHPLQRICEFLQGMPLGLELAAAWTEALPLAEIAREIERS